MASKDVKEWFKLRAEHLEHRKAREVPRKDRDPQKGKISTFFKGIRPFFRDSYPVFKAFLKGRRPF